MSDAFAWNIDNNINWSKFKQGKRTVDPLEGGDVILLHVHHQLLINSVLQVLRVRHLALGVAVLFVDVLLYLLAVNVRSLRAKMRTRGLFQSLSQK